MSRLRLRASLSSAVLGLVLLAVPRFALAACPGECTPQFDALGGLVGCCNEDCTWKAGTNADLECINPANPCQQGHCWDDFGPANTCQGSKASGGTNFSAVEDHPFCLTGNACLIGECYQETCKQIDNDPENGFLDRCEYLNDDQCKNETCTLIGGQFDPAQSCLNPPNESDGTPCSDGDTDPCEIDTCQSGVCTGSQAPDNTVCGGTGGSVCTPSVCQAGACNPSQACTTINDCPTGSTACQSGVCVIGCSGSLSICEKWQCGFQGTTAVCSQVSDTGKSCDVSGTDCKVQTCNANKRCITVKLDPGTGCDTTLSDCNTGTCDSRARCGGFFPDPTLDGQVCDDADGNICSQAKCNDQGACTPNNCNGVAVCGCGGSCAGSVGSCLCQ